MYSGDVDRLVDEHPRSLLLDELLARSIQQVLCGSCFQAMLIVLSMNTPAVFLTQSLLDSVSGNVLDASIQENNLLLRLPSGLRYRSIYSEECNFLKFR